MHGNWEESNAKRDIIGFMRRRRALPPLISFCAVALLLTLVVAMTPQGRAAVRTTLFILQVLDQPIKPLSWLSDEPVREVGIYRSVSNRDIADIYRVPDGRPRPAVILGVGANPKGLGDPEVINLGRALAMSGFVAMIHWSPEMGLDANISPEEPRRIVDAYLYLEGQDYVDPKRMGLGGFCVGASLALVAAADPRISERVAFVNAFGPFYDAEGLLMSAASRSVLYEGERVAWQPDSLTLRVLANELIEILDDRSDKEILIRIYTYGEEVKPSEMASMSPRGRLATRLLEGVSEEDVEELYLSLPRNFRDNLAKISPATYIGEIRARLLIMHDRNDLMVPVTESRLLVEATQSRLDVRYTELSGFDHILPEAGGLFTRVRQGAQLYAHLYHILRIAA